MPLAIWDWFNFGHFAPAFGAAALAKVANVPVINATASATAITLRMGLFSAYLFPNSRDLP
jgi:hypothetical protein